MVSSDVTRKDPVTQNDNNKVTLISNLFNLNEKTLKIPNVDISQALSWECKLEPPFWKAIGQYPLKLNIHIPYKPAIPLPVYTQQE